MSDRELRWIRAGDALIALARAYADAMQVEWAEALKRSQATILRYLSAGHWPARAGAYHCEKAATDPGGKRVGFKLQKIWDHDNREWVIPSAYWKVLQQSGADQNANWHLGEFDLPAFHDGTGTYSGFARNVAFDRAHLADGFRLSMPEEPKDKGRPGRPGLGTTEYCAELERRISASDLESGVAAQARALRDWFCAQYPDKQAPKAVTIENEIRARYREAKNPMD